MAKSEFENQLDELEARLARLKAMYDQYFQGIERIPPEKEHTAVDKMIKRMLREQPRNTALRFRYNTIRQRFITLGNYWTRTLRQIEEGTYRRHVQKAKRRREREEARSVDRGYELDLNSMDDFDMDAEVAAALGALEPLDGEKTDPSIQAGQPPPPPAMASFAPPRGAAPPPPPPGSPTAVFGKPAPGVFGRPRDDGAPHVAGRALPSSGPPPQSGPVRLGGPPPPPPAAGRRPPPPPPPRRPPPAAGGGVGEDRMREIYQSYVQARRRNNERVDNVRYETVAKSIEKMMPKLQQKHGGKKIDFEVVVKDGKVGLKPVTGK